MAKRMNGSGDFADQVQELRARIADLKAEIAILEGAPRLVGVAIQEAERWVQARAAEFRPSTSLFWNRASAADNFALFGFALPS